MFPIPMFCDLFLWPVQGVVFAIQCSLYVQGVHLKDDSCCGVYVVVTDLQANESLKEGILTPVILGVGAIVSQGPNDVSDHVHA